MRAASEENMKGVAKVAKEIRRSSKEKPGFIVQCGERTPPRVIPLPKPREQGTRTQGSREEDFRKGVNLWQFVITAQAD